MKTILTVRGRIHNPACLVPRRLILAAFAISTTLHAQTLAPDGAEAATPDPEGATSEALDEEGDEVITLSPFSVTTSADKGYRATNTISGTRLDASLRDVPLSIEVITSDFIRDIGAQDLRQALRFSAGVQLVSQNDYAGNGLTQFQNLGGVNSPEMQTGNKTGTTMVLRGFTTENALRDGFRRKVSTDAANVDRIEVVRGPSALLYGTGNFGGVVNYLVKTPQRTRADATEIAIGSHGLARATVDSTGPFGGTRGAYRFTAAVQKQGDYTDYYDSRRFALATVLTFRLGPDTELTADLEYGESDSSGVGFQSLRARADAIGNNGRLEHAGFVAFPGRSLRTMRWSGPDTYLDSDQGNLVLKLTHRLADGVDLLAGYNHSSVTFRSRDVDASIGNNIGPMALWSTLIPVPLDAERGDTDANWAASPVPHSIVAYSWADRTTGTRADQGRVELSWKFAMFGDSANRALTNNLLFGMAAERDNNRNLLHTLDSANSVYNWKSVADPSPFRFATQGDGSPSLPLRLRQRSSSTARQVGSYFVYQGKFLRDRVTVLGGLRYDNNRVSTSDTGYRYADGSIDPGATNAWDPAANTAWTSQIGVSIAPIRAVTLYALRSEGLNPNFAGARDLTGRPMDAVEAVNREIGLKFDLLDGRISGTISRYRITREGQPNGSFWWAPQTAVQRFDATRPVVYNVTDLNPDAARRYFYQDNTGSTVPLVQWNNNYAYWGDLSGLSEVPAGAAGSTATLEGLRSYQSDGLNAQRAAIGATWDAARMAGAVRYWSPEGASIAEPDFAALVSASGPSGGYITLDASSPEGAAYMDAVYSYVRQAGIAHPGSDNWPGWFFNSAPAFTGYNSAALDTNGFANSPALSAPERDRNDGWDGQIVITPGDDWQLLMSFSRNNHTVLSLGQFPDYPHQELDRWAPWMFANGQWGLSGYYAPDEQYADESRTSTFSFKGLIYPGAQGMDYPKFTWSIFANGRLDRAGLRGWRVGGGVVWTGPQEYTSGFTHGGDALKDSGGAPLILRTPVRWSAHLTIHRSFELHDRKAFIQANIDNLFDDRDRYGFLWAPGRTVRVSIGMEL